MLYKVYRVAGRIVWLTLLLSSPLLKRFGSTGPGFGLAQRLGWYPELADKRPGVPRIWIHAASVGEVKAARALVGGLRARSQELEIVLTTMTRQGHRVAARQLAGQAVCLMAPLDAAPAVRRALSHIRPDCYICLETELWPVMLSDLSHAGIPMLLLNGRMSERSCRRYRHLGPLVPNILAGFVRIGVISETDRARFQALGVPGEKIEVTGNVKFDPGDEADPAGRERFRSLLGVRDEIVFVSGSTRTGEEILLADVVQHLRRESGRDIVWVVAPRHLERLDTVRRELSRQGLDCDLFSVLQGGAARRHRVVLVDTMGDLAELYAAGDYLFCGGSLVDKGGHNIMEAVRWGRPVYFGPSMKDFRDAVDLVVQGGCGFQVRNTAELARTLLAHMADREKYSAICAAARRVSRAQKGAAGRQAAMVMEVIQRAE
ncbi:3-deoxy-D-manno-octulosonic acid transferase [Desulfolithobacter dissulfuricans]|uniref:3-deoxy-D-manno-octulosonic acid transferase n=1 Tax=Desulfolithobacter dissulfuricans TaxID=2795293 RepID=A0A915TYI8_9BACT|nr:glycosyltransferase N-terminal domain-containing protein [Desulfolithobacter dissulfuricans]BCO08161.1 3-deoxy-D-manno-octulosonic acid transferase [Desulfolithobacter dissulfuricans]